MAFYSFGTQLVPLSPFILVNLDFLSFISVLWEDMYHT